MKRVLCLRIRFCAAPLSESDSADAIVARIETLMTSSEDRDDHRRPPRVADLQPQQ
jgi:hypothetical protein